MELYSVSKSYNDPAYSGLTQGQAHVPLAQIAKDYPDLEWMELYSVSKSYNDPGARLGAIVGSKDFVEDYTLVKGNTDSGPVPGVMAAYGEFFADRVRAQQELRNIRELYEKRTAYLIPRFKSAGLQPACTTEAGFFTLWRVPESIFGKTLPTEGRHETFNRLVISETGIVGVHFSGFTADHQPEPLIRYAVCADVLDKKFQTRFEERLARLKPIYS
jgi:aspartate/methionine/tyrosine aminotransferase